MATNYPIFKNQKHDAGDDYQITFTHPFGAVANIDQAWLAVRNLERSPSQTVFETLETTFAKFNFSTSGVGVVTIAASDTEGKTPGFYQYDIQLVGTPQVGDFSGVANTTLTVSKGDWYLRPNAANSSDTSLLLPQWELAYQALATEADIREAADDALDLRVDDLETAVALQSSLFGAIYARAVLAHFPLIDGSGETQFESQSPYNGAWYGSPTTVGGVRATESNVYTDGVDDVFDFYSTSLSNNFDSDAFSISLFFKPTAGLYDGGSHFMLTLGYDTSNLLGLSTIANNLILTYKKTGESDLTPVIVTGALPYTWQHIAISVGDGTLVVYLNGSEIYRNATATGWTAGIAATLAKLAGYAANEPPLFPSEMGVGHFTIFDEIIGVNDALAIATAAGVNASAAAQTAVFFGDSITSGGFGEDTPYSTQLCALTGWIEQNEGIGGTPLQNTAQTVNAPGTTGSPAPAANNGRDRFSADVLSHDPDWIVILYGINDMYLVRDGQPSPTVAAFETQLGEIVDLAIADGVAPYKIVLCSVPIISGALYTNATYAGVTVAQHKLYNAAVQDVATAKSCTFVDVHFEMFTRGNVGNLVEHSTWETDADVIHPNTIGHRVIANAIYDAARQYL